MCVTAAPPFATLIAMFFWGGLISFFPFFNLKKKVLFFFAIASIILPTPGFVRNGTLLLYCSLWEFAFISPLKEMLLEGCFHSAP